MLGITRITGEPAGNRASKKAVVTPAATLTRTCSAPPGSAPAAGGGDLGHHRLDVAGLDREDDEFRALQRLPDGKRPYGVVVRARWSARSETRSEITTLFA